MTWNSFFHHRKIRRRYNLASSLALSSSAFFLGTQTIAAQPNLDIFNFVGGVEPIFVAGGVTLAVGAVGWLAGPSVGGWVFGRVGMRGRGREGRGEFRAKEREFFKHVQKYRPNAGYSSTTNPLPDWYGEKIGSLREYRTWLKDQRAFNKKREVILI
ncbi:MAG: TIM23 complex component [Ramalina farinacea]|uniref:Presequence translocated-associated motor subunit PAM17 n=1 Tax=Ramalina farinacea TaxID=258253 RepID=A0AA43QX55_9LECA|nr:TIM23 complex component [Ramalina farinacea]